MRQYLTHLKIVPIVPSSVNIQSLSETEAGVCEYEAGQECTITTEYVLNGSDISNFHWTVTGTGATLINTDGTNKAQVRTTSDATINFNVKCDVSNSISTDTINANFTHTRTESIAEGYYGELLYDNTNMETEFLATSIGPDNYMYSLTLESFNYINDGDSALLHHIETVFGPEWTIVDFNDFKNITANYGGDFRFMEALGILAAPMPYSDCYCVKYNNSYTKNSTHAYFVYDGNGTNDATNISSNPAGTMYLGSYNVDFRYMIRRIV